MAAHDPPTLSVSFGIRTDIGNTLREYLRK